MKKIMLDKKREELIDFIRSQMIGPGGCQYRFGVDGIEDGEEVLNTTPGSIYSTAILFPEKIVDDTAESQEDNNELGSSQTISATNDDNVEGLIEQSDLDTGNVDGEDSFTMARRFPTTIAISCCLNEDCDLNKDVDIRITGRYYTKISGHEKQITYIQLENAEVDFVKNFIVSSDTLKNRFKIKDNKLYINFTSTDAKSVFIEIQDCDQTEAKTISEEISKAWGNQILSNVKAEHLYLSTCRNNLYKFLSSDMIQCDIYNDVFAFINKIGRMEQVLNFLKDLTHIYYNSGYGFWKSHKIDKRIRLSEIDFNKGRRTYSPEIPGCTDLKVKITNTLSLSVLLQLTKDYRNRDNKKKYFKVMLQNSSEKFVETVKNHYTIVNEELNKLCIFDAKIEVHSDKLAPYRFGGNYQDPAKEDDKLKFLYRNIQDYAIGNLCSVDWEKVEKPTKVWTEFLPIYDLPDVEPVPRNKYAEWSEEGDSKMPPMFIEDSRAQNFHWLSTFSDATSDEIRNKLTEFVEKYKEWITKSRESNSTDDEIQNAFIDYTLEQCQADRDRMLGNIERILSDDNHLWSFRLMNSAMLMQIWHNNDHYSLVRDEKLTPDFYEDKGCNYKWRPFQLAFILLNLDGIIRRSDDNRWEKRNELVDLVWFPTGGGKTEAYLGIIAFTIINRRRTCGDAGTTAIMRYTLRMLANQQFLRALKLILALDQIRIWGNDNNEYCLGSDPVSIGLFVGGGSLPNQYENPQTNHPEPDKYLVDAARLWNNRRDGDTNITNIPIDRCPWCGEPLVWGNRGVYNRGGKRLNHFHCSNDRCTFHNYLPTQLCDELIYADPPTLLFGTVDKFAQLARKVHEPDNTSTFKTIRQDSRRLFGKGLNVRKPELIIQDELHLLLGPLGSAVSLFEAAIDQLCTNEENVNGRTLYVRPKIISSTATTRNTAIQIRALYDRDVNIFPKSGVDYDDSFFAFYRRENKNDNVEWISKRRYLGIMPTGRTQMLTQIRLASILFVHRALFERDHWKCDINDEAYNFAADNYYSIVSYFNSLKEVGKTDAQYPYEFIKYLQRLYRRVIGYAGMLDCLYADENCLTKTELTGRLNGAQIVANQKLVERSFSVDKRLNHFEGGVLVRGITPPDFILATNMISVGLDVSRFNTIIMNSMPRNIAEYIQASSRVARSEKGLVITLHNPFAARDVSHFEKYIEFHKKMYYYVEPISITPFSSQSAEKYLPLYLGTMLRHTHQDFVNNDSANNIQNIDVTNLHDRLMTYFNERLNRSNSIKCRDQELTKRLKEIFDDRNRDFIEGFIEQALHAWNILANNSLWFYDNSARRERPENFLYVETEEYDDIKDDSMWIVPNSLRIVDPEAVIKIKNNYN